jgi:hypothetical protein
MLILHVHVCHVHASKALCLHVSICIEVSLTIYVCICTIPNPYKTIMKEIDTCHHDKACVLLVIPVWDQAMILTYRWHHVTTGNHHTQYVMAVYSPLSISVHWKMVKSGWTHAPCLSMRASPENDQLCGSLNQPLLPPFLVMSQW